MRNFAAENTERFKLVSEPIVTIDPNAIAKTENYRYAAISFMLGLMFGGTGAMSIALSRSVASEHIAKDFQFNVTALNRTQTVECPVNRDWANVSMIVQACQLLVEHCGNTSLLNNTFQFMLNITNDTVDGAINATGRCVGTDVRGTDYVSAGLFFIVAAIFLAGSVAYLLRASKVGTASAADVEAGNRVTSPAAVNRHRVLWHDQVNDQETCLLAGVSTPRYGLPREL
ncbi:MAG: hypothetical protein Q8L78_06040 [Coxiellaceae bacterium]|nr:hypothetical protein [Coxiellaceae bacterium]